MNLQSVIDAFSQEGAPVTGSMERGVDHSAAFAASSPLAELKPRLQKIEQIVEQKAGMVNVMKTEEKERMFAIAQYVRDTHEEAPEATGRIGLLELALDVKKDTMRSVGTSDLNKILEKFKPVDPQADLQKRIDAIGERLTEVAQSAESMSAQQRATMLEATKYAMELSPDAANAQGKIMFLESALKIQKSNLRSTR